LVDAFQRANDLFDAAARQFPYASPWLIEDVEQSEQQIGPHAYAPGIEANRHMLDQFCDGAHRDGMTSRRVTVDEMFAEFLAT
jgi:4,5-dihydroxyphthalate decarboxylase